MSTQLELRLPVGSLPITVIVGTGGLRDQSSATHASDSSDPDPVLRRGIQWFLSRPWIIRHVESLDHLERVVHTRRVYAATFPNL